MPIISAQVDDLVHANVNGALRSGGLPEKKPEDIAEYIHAAIEDGSEQVMPAVMQDVARAVMEMAETQGQRNLT